MQKPPAAVFLRPAIIVEWLTLQDCGNPPGCDLDHVLHPERNDSVVVIKRRGSIMPTIFDFLYREYCRARLAEMRKQLLLVSARSRTVPAANCDVSDPGGSAGRDSGFGDERTTTHEARHIH